MRSIYSLEGGGYLWVFALNRPEDQREMNDMIYGEWRRAWEIMMGGFIKGIMSEEKYL